MENLKTKGIFTILFTVTIFLALTLGNVFAVEKIYIPVNLTVKNSSGTILKNGAELGAVKPGDKITATAYCNNEIALKWSQDQKYMAEEGYKSNDKGMALLSYMFDSEDKTKYMHSSDPTSLTITIPNYAPGTEHYVVINAVAACDGLPEGKKVYQATSGTFGIRFKIADEEKITANLAVLYKEKKVNEGSTTIVSNGDKVVITGTPGENIKSVNVSVLNKDSMTASADIWVKHPSYPGGYSKEPFNNTISIVGKPGETIQLTVSGILVNQEKIASQLYYFKIAEIPSEPEEPDKPMETPDIPNEVPDDSEEEIEKLTGTINAKIAGENIKNNETIKVNGTEEIQIIGTPANNFASIKYKWDDEEEIEEYGSSILLPVFADKGITHTLKVRGILTDGVKTTTKTYHFVVEEDDDLIVEPWMREDNKADGLLVSLRNDSDEEKANKNFYKLNEEIIYYVDYKSCGKDIKREVKLSLKLPLNFEVVKSAAGTISKSDKTITWLFEDGLEEGAAGTKEIILKYTKLGKSTIDHEVVYPQANIYKNGKQVDSSAVINFIYLNESTVIKEEHEPYMIGDAGTKTFRPDDTITRAEGALVLTRIFGIKVMSNNVSGKFSDLSTTYPEAQRAITAATELGLINGYEDGTYRPNDKMTRAEFMKIIASFIEYTSQKDGINGLEVKEDASIKVYDNPLIKEHWAIDYVTLLTRLNMTPVSTSKQNLRLNDEITRAEVAQLVNYYSLRAPAKVTASTKTGFIDVQKNHELFEDIVEATREAHKYIITDDAKEREK